MGEGGREVGRQQSSGRGDEYLLVGATDLGATPRGQGCWFGLRGGPLVQEGFHFVALRGAIAHPSSPLTCLLLTSGISAVGMRRPVYSAPLTEPSSC